MTRKEAERLTRQADSLRSLGFTSEEAEQLRRISMTLHRWHELECGNDHGCIEREEATNKPFWSSSHVPHRRAIADRETGALKRLDKIISERNKRAVKPGSSKTALGYYIQTDPRGAALYIIRPDDVPVGADVSAYYNRGICVY
jgi:hypothetical protein